MIGKEIYQFAKLLWPLNRSISGDGVRETLRLIQSHLPDLQIFEVQSGTKVFDWVVPKEWRIRDAYIETPRGERICEFKKNNLHIVGYSTPVNRYMSLNELQNYLYSLPEQPTAIPYVTSYYRERFGFCLSDNQRKSLEEGTYKVVIDSDLIDGSLTYGEYLIPGKSSQEVFISTYICHPSMANNELSGPTVTTFLGRWLNSLKERRYTYRIVFIPETIGSIIYLSQNLKVLRENVICGFNVSCIGDDRAYSYLPTRSGLTLADQVALHVLKYIDENYVVYTWNDRGSDERQYCAPHIDLPVVSIMRTKYGEYPEYHTSLDDLINVVTPSGLEGGFKVLQRAIEAIETNYFPVVKVLGEPQLGKRGLYPNLSTKNSSLQVKTMMNLITWSDGAKSLLEIADLCDVPIWELIPIAQKLVEHDLIEFFEFPTKRRIIDGD